MNHQSKEEKRTAGRVNFKFSKELLSRMSSDFGIQTDPLHNVKSLGLLTFEKYSMNRLCSLPPSHLNHRFHRPGHRACSSSEALLSVDFESYSHRLF